MLAGNSSIKSAHLQLRESISSGGFTGAGDELLSNGKTVAMDLTEQISNAGRIRFRIVHGEVFAQLPTALYRARKPWVQLTANTANPTLRQLYLSFQSSLATGAGDSVRIFVAATKNLELVGTLTLDRARVAHYRVPVEVALLPVDFPGRAALAQSGLKTIPVELYVDEHGRTRKVTESLTVAGQHVSVDTTLTKIDAPVTIIAPPASQVEQVP